MIAHDKKWRPSDDDDAQWQARQTEAMSESKTEAPPQVDPRSLMRRRERES